MTVLAAVMLVATGGVDAAREIFSLPWWVQILPGLNIAGLVMAIRRISRLELMVETMWQSGTWTVPEKKAHR